MSRTAIPILVFYLLATVASFGQHRPSSADSEYSVGDSILRQAAAPSESEKNPELLRSALSHFEKALAINPSHLKALQSAGFAEIQLAERVNRQGGYTWVSRVDSAAYLVKGAENLARVVKLGPASTAGARKLLMNTYLQLGRIDDYQRMQPPGATTDKEFTYLEGRWITRDRAVLRAVETQAASGGHMPWRSDAVLVTEVIVYNGLSADHRPRPTETETTAGKRLALTLRRPGEITVIKVKQSDTRSAKVEIRTNGRLDATVRLQRPFGGDWWYVTSYRFNVPSENHH